jgi:hypothetical protein
MIFSVCWQGWQRRWFVFHKTKGQLQYFKTGKVDPATGQPDKAEMEIRGAVDIR